MPRITKWKLLKTVKIFEKYHMRLERRDYVQPNGKVADYYIRTGSPAACVLALTTEGKIITVRQYRPGPNAILHELPGGFADEGETPLQAAVRELMEETGYTGTIRHHFRYLEDAYNDRVRWGVVMTDCYKVAEPHLDGREFCEVVLRDLDEFLVQVRAGELTDPATALLGLDFLGLLRPAKK